MDPPLRRSGLRRPTESTDTRVDTGSEPLIQERGTPIDPERQRGETTTNRTITSAVFAPDYSKPLVFFLGNSVSL
jgi:hypothetical protein